MQKHSPETGTSSIPRDPGLGPERRQLLRWLCPLRGRCQAPMSAPSPTSRARLAAVSELGSLPGIPVPESQVSVMKEDFIMGRVQLEARLDPKTQTLSPGHAFSLPLSPWLSLTLLSLPPPEDKMAAVAPGSHAPGSAAPEDPLQGSCEAFLVGPAGSPTCPFMRHPCPTEPQPPLAHPAYDRN